MIGMYVEIKCLFDKVQKNVVFFQKNDLHICYAKEKIIFII